MSDVMEIEQLECGCQTLVNPMLTPKSHWASGPERMAQVEQWITSVQPHAVDRIYAYSCDERNVAVERYADDMNGERMICRTRDHAMTFVEVHPL